MQRFPTISVMMVAALLADPAAALTVLECTDSEGDVSYRFACPPGSEKTGEKELRGVGTVEDEPDLQDIAAENPVTVYSVPDCDACDLVRNALAGRGIPFEEIDVQDNAERQEAMKEATGGLTVPAIMIGERVITGYSRDAIDVALEQAGYPLGGAPTAATE